MTTDEPNNTIPDIWNNSDIMSCIDEFLGKECLVALKSTRQDPDDVRDQGQADVAGNDGSNHVEDKGTRLCRIQIGTALKHVTTKGCMVVEQTVSVEEPFGMSVKYHKGRPLVSSDGGLIASIESDNAVNVEFVRYNDGTRAGKLTNQSETVKLPEPAFGLMIVGTSVYIGFAASIGWVNFSSPNPVCQVLLRRDFIESRGRCYDRFLKHGEKLIVIGNMLGTNYAEVFDTSESGGIPLYVENWTLPATFSAQYIFVGTTDDDLIIVYDIAGIRENSQCILRKALSGLSPEQRRKMNLDQARGSIANHNVGRFWMDFAVQRTAHGDSNKILIAAGKNGLLSFPAKFQHNTAPTKLPLSDCVSGVSTFEDEIWVLVSGSSVDSKSWVMNVNSNTKVPLPGHFDRLL